MRESFLCSWSGGKDSCFAFHLAAEKKITPIILLNVLNEFGDRSRSHGISKEVLEAQANVLGIPIHFFESTWNDYEKLYINNLKSLTEQYDISTAVFGDIDIETHKEWEEKVANAAQLKPILPLWHQERKQLVLDMIDYGIEAIIVSCNQVLGPEFLGKTIDRTLVNELEELGVDVCGENGEYHTLVINAPLFRKKINITFLERQESSNYNFLNLKLNRSS